MADLLGIAPHPRVAVQPAPTMDHRGLVGCGGGLYVVGGLVAGPEVSRGVWRLQMTGR